MFQFTVRELLLLTATVGLGAGWWIDHWAMDRAKDRAVIEAIMNPPEPCGFSQNLYPVTEAPVFAPLPSSMSQTISEQQAIVSDFFAKQDPNNQFECTVSATPEGYSVFVQCFILDENGKRQYSVGSHCLFLLSKSGELLRIIGGA